MRERPRFKKQKASWTCDGCRCSYLVTITPGWISESIKQAIREDHRRVSPKCQRKKLTLQSATPIPGAALHFTFDDNMVTFSEGIIGPMYRVK